MGEFGSVDILKLISFYENRAFWLCSDICAEGPNQQ